MMTNYDLEMERIKTQILELKAERIGLQFPEGLKTHAVNIARDLESNLGVKVLISADPCFGACDIADRAMYGIVDIIVHVGHTPLPIKSKVPVIFVEAHFNLDIDDTIEKALDLLTEYKCIGLVTTAQHLHLVDDVVDLLEEHGKKVIVKEGQGTKKGQVLGCNFTAIKDLPVEAYLYLGSGNFHPLGIKIFTKKPVIIADPYHSEVRDIEKLADRVLRIRFAQIIKAKEAMIWGILISTKTGQFQVNLAEELKNKIQEKGKEAYLLLMENITPEIIMPFRDVDAYVVTACPRIAVDDAQLYEKPLLTPSELEIVFDEREWADYKMDEIIH